MLATLTTTVIWLLLTSWTFFFYFSWCCCSLCCLGSGPPWWGLSDLLPTDDIHWGPGGCSEAGLINDRRQTYQQLQTVLGNPCYGVNVSKSCRSLGVRMECRVRCLLQSCISMQSYSGYKAGVEPVFCVQTILATPPVYCLLNAEFHILKCWTNGDTAQCSHSDVMPSKCLPL